MDEKNKLKFSSFIYIKADEKYRHLIRNERIAAGEELANLIVSLQEKIFLRTYLLKGLRSDCDMLLWLMAPDIEFIQNAWAQVSTTGAGKYFDVRKCFVGLCKTVESERKHSCPYEPGGRKYMLMHPIVRHSSWYELSNEKQDELYSRRKEILNRYENVNEHFFYSYGLGDYEMLVVRESADLEVLAEVSEKLRQQKIKLYTKTDTPCFLCVGTDLLEILGKLG